MAAAESAGKETDQFLPVMEYDYKEVLARGRWRCVTKDIDQKHGHITNPLSGTLTQASLRSLVLEKSGLFGPNKELTKLGQAHLAPTIEKQMQKARVFQRCTNWASEQVFGSQKLMNKFNGDLKIGKWHNTPVTYAWLAAAIEYNMDPIPLDIKLVWDCTKL